MPKEVIYGRWYAKAPKDVDGNEVGPPNQQYVAVGWTGNERHAAQIGLVDPNKGGPNDDEQMWMDLDRPSINQLIRALRKARDQSFGRDE